MSETASIQRDDDFGASSDKLGMWMFLCGDAMMFIALFMGYAMIRLSNAAAWPNPEVQLNVPLTAVFTFDLIVSSVTMVKAFEASDNDNEGWTKFWLAATIFFGLCFLGFQAYEWTELLHHKHKIPGHLEGVENLFYSTFFALTGFHGLHVTGGVIYLSVVLFNVWRGKYHSLEERSEALEIAGLYWHLVDLVWILLFTFIYLF